MIRKITSKQEEERKKKKNQIIVGAVLVGIMILSTLAYSFGSNTGEAQQGSTTDYNGHEFTYLNGLWQANISGMAFGFINNPNSAYKAGAYVRPLADYYGKPLYLYSEDSDSELEIYRNLYSSTQDISYACPDGQAGCDASLPVKTCQDNFIIIRRADAANISQENSCVFISGQQQDLTKITDGFLLKAIGA
jgi:hypothetical protein